VTEARSEISLYRVGVFLLRWHRVILSFSAFGAGLGLVSTLMIPDRYTSSATFLPNGAESSVSGLGAVANQLGIGTPTAGGGWGSTVYVELLQSSTLLRPILLDTVVIREEGDRRSAIIDLLDVPEGSLGTPLDHATRVLSGMIESRELTAIGAVQVEVTTRWPSVSLALAELLMRGVDRFHVQTRSLEAAAEREFAAGQAAHAERTLRQAELDLQRFLEANRVVGSPQLMFENDRLQREVALRQQLYSFLLQNQEEARLREARDIPVVTILEEPQLPLFLEARYTLGRIVVGGSAAALLMLLAAFVAEGLANAKKTRDPDAIVFFRRLREAIPGGLSRRMGLTDIDAGESQ